MTLLGFKSHDALIFADVEDLTVISEKIDTSKARKILLVTVHGAKHKKYAYQKYFNADSATMAKLQNDNQN